MKLLQILLFTILFLSSCTRTVYVLSESKEISHNADSLERLMSEMLAHQLSIKENQKVFVTEKSTFIINEQGDTTKTVIEKETDSSKEWFLKEAFMMAVIDSLKERV